MDFSCAQSMWTYNEAAIALAAAVFGKRLQEHQDIVFIWIHGKDKHDRLLVQIVLNGLTEAP